MQLHQTHFGVIWLPPWQATCGIRTEGDRLYDNSLCTCVLECSNCPIVGNHWLCDEEASPRSRGTGTKPSQSNTRSSHYSAEANRREQTVDRGPQSAGSQCR